MNLPFPHQKSKPLNKLTTFGIGGEARYFAEAKTPDQIRLMLAFCYQEQIPTFILGKGSNCLFDDRGFSGLVILNRIDHFEQHEEKFRVGAGYSFARLGSQSSRSGWSGLEFACGIPAAVGGAIYMNAGANGKETSDHLVEVSYVTEKGEFVRFKKEELTFSYRASSFQNWKGAIVEGVFRLHRSEEAKIEQKSLLEYRLKTQPYKDKSAGCVFRNPNQTAAGRLIEECGLKGFRIGGAVVSDKHANFIVNAGEATAQDVLHLIEKIKETVYQKKGIILEEEIRYVAPEG